MKQTTTTPEYDYCAHSRQPGVVDAIPVTLYFFEFCLSHIGSSAQNATTPATQTGTFYFTYLAVSFLCPLKAIFDNKFCLPKMFLFFLF